jgi:ABC-type amino acid transport system permease subunit
MSNLVKALIGLSALAFVLAVLASFSGPILHTVAEGYSRASTNLALLAIALVLTFGGTTTTPRSL